MTLYIEIRVNNFLFQLSRGPGALQHRCPADKFECSNGSCIDRKLLCNGFSDCPEGDDERNDTCQNNK